MNRDPLHDIESERIYRKQNLKYALIAGFSVIIVIALAVAGWVFVV